MEEATPRQTELAPEIRRFVERVGAGEKVTADGTWFAGEDAEAETARPYNITDLINIRGLVRKTAEAYKPGDINANALRKLLDSVDDTIEQLVEASGDETAILTHRKLRDDYRQDIKALEADSAYILGNGDLTELLKDRTRVNGKSRLEILIARVGPDAVKKFANMLLDSKIREASTTLKNGKPVIGVVRPEEVLAWYKELRAVPGTNKFFQVDAETSARYAKMMADLEDIASVKRMVKRGIVAAILVLLVLALVALLFILKRHG
jgi:hypothetical protein